MPLAITKLMRFLHPMLFKPSTDCTWDLLSLGEVMLRFDPGEGRIRSARNFRVWEGGGEYNVARAFSHCFGLRGGIVTSLVDNEIGRLVEDLMKQGGVELSELIWSDEEVDVHGKGTALSLRNGLNFVERGFGGRPPKGCSDRSFSAISQLQVSDIDWDRIFSESACRVFHTGGVFAGLSDTTAEVAQTAMVKAKATDTQVSYDLNYRKSLWNSRGGRAAANRINRDLITHADVVFGVLDLPSSTKTAVSKDVVQNAMQKMQLEFPHLSAIVTSLRHEHHANLHSWGGACLSPDGFVYSSPEDIAILDRVGGGDAFASGFLMGQLQGASIQESLNYAVAHGAIAMSTPGDTSMATLDEVIHWRGKKSEGIER